MTNAIVEAVHRPILAKVLEEAGFDPAMAETVTWKAIGRPDPRVDISFDMSGDFPVMVSRVSGVEKRQGTRWLTLAASPDPRRRRRGWRLFARILRARS